MIQWMYMPSKPRASPPQARQTKRFRRIRTCVSTFLRPLEFHSFLATCLRKDMILKQSKDSKQASSFQKKPHFSSPPSTPDLLSPTTDLSSPTTDRPSTQEPPSALRNLPIPQYSSAKGNETEQTEVEEKEEQMKGKNRELMKKEETEEEEVVEAARVLMSMRQGK